MEKKKLLFITKNFMPEVGGGLRRIEAVYNLLTGNDKIDLEVVTAVKQNNNYKNVKYIKQLFFKDKKFADTVSFKKTKNYIKLIDKALLGWIPNVIRYLFFKKFDYIYVSCPSFSNIIAGYIYKKIKLNRPKLIIEYRDLFSFNPSYVNDSKKKRINKYEKKVLKNADYIIVTTSPMKNILSEIVNPDRIFLIRNYMGKRENSKIKHLKKIPMNNKFYNIGYVGKLNTGRNPDKIIELLELDINGKKTALHFVGTNNKEKEFIIETACKKNFDKSRLFFTPMVDRETSLQYMKSFDSLLLIVNNEVLIKDGYGIPGKLYDYIIINNNIFSDKDTFNNLNSEFDCSIKKEFNNFVNYSVNDITNLDSVFHDIVFKKILNVKNNENI